MELHALFESIGPMPTKLPIQETLAELETAVKYQPRNDKVDVRKTLKPLLKEVAYIRHNKSVECEVMKILKEKDVYYLKADKGTFCYKRRKFVVKSKNPLISLVKQVQEGIVVYRI